MVVSVGLEPERFNFRPVEIEALLFDLFFFIELLSGLEFQ